MKCPYCDAVLNGENICGVCEKKIEIPGQEVEIEYKEFKISEFLEIRKKQEKSHSGTACEKAGKDLRKTSGKSYGISGAESRNNKKAETRTEETGKNLFWIVIIITVIAAVVAGAFYLPRFFLQQ